MSDATSQAIVRLFETERFYAELISQMQRISTKSIGTAGVCIKQQIELHINHDWFDKLPIEQRVATLKHECEHIYRGHIPRFKELAPEIYAEHKRPTSVEEAADQQLMQWQHRSMNIAADCAINCHIQDIGEDACHAKNFDLPDGETFEWYHEHLKNNEKAKQFMEFDGHSLWAESETDQEMLKEKIRKLVSEAAKKTRAAGMMTANDELLVEGWLKPATVSWVQQLRRFVARTTEAVREDSRKKRNRRYGIRVPGVVKKEVLHIGAAIDTSGSMSDEALAQIMAEINNISKYARVTVVEADSEVKNTYEYKPGRPQKVKGRGGTAYQPALDFFNREGDIDAIIYFGDMDNHDNETLTKPKYPVLWAIVGNQEPPAEWGARIEVKV